MNKLFVGLLVTFLCGVVVCQPDKDKQPMAVKFLRHYGYLPAPGRNGSGDVPAAIRKFQEFFGLKTNGLLNAETMKLMKKSRCGNPDPSGGRRRQRRYATTSKWVKNDLTYYVQPGEDLSADQQKEIFAEALKFWSDVSGLTFTEVNSANSADIKLNHEL